VKVWHSETLLPLTRACQALRAFLALLGPGPAFEGPREDLHNGPEKSTIEGLNP
jgi:hypothetical protein